MSQVRTPASGYRFDEFFIDATNRQLSRAGEPVPLNSKYFDVLLLLVSRGGRLVEKRNIFDEVWDGVFVTDAALTQCVKDIRRQLGDDASNPRYIKTVPKHGYIFIGNVVEAEVEASQAVARQRPAVVATSDSEPVSTAYLRPYKFLDYYTERDAGLFFGREQEVEAICSHILAHRSFVLHGRSGVGKSSIIRAGLMPRLKTQGHRVFVVRSFTDPLPQIVLALTGSRDEQNEDESRLIEIAAAVEGATDSLTIFFFDQFEEFFSLLSPESKDKFVDFASQLLAREPRHLRFVFALREDMLAEMSQLKAAIPEIFHHEYRLKRLSREQAARAISEPARRVGCEYETALVERLLNDLSDDKGVDPPQLQIVCDNLYDSRNQRGVVTCEIYDRLGTASNILAGYLERVLRRFGPADLQVAKSILSELISADGLRLVLRVRDLELRVFGTKDDSAIAAQSLIEELVGARVVRRRSQGGEAWVELAHDFLTPEIGRWLTADDVALKRARGVMERAVENYEAHALMIDVDAIELLLPFGERLRLNDKEADLLFYSCLGRIIQAPGWLVESAPEAPRMISEASESPDPNKRLEAVNAAGVLRTDEMRSLLRRLALWDRDLGVRKAASIELARWLGAGAGEILARDENGERVGSIRRAISLAMIRDQDKRLVSLLSVSMPVGLLVIAGLMWVRLRRNGAEILRQGLGGVLGGAASGFVGGLMLGLGLAAARHAPTIEAMELSIVLTALGSVIGGIGALGVSFGMISLAQVAYRHSRWWAVAGGAAGGALVGGSSKLLSVDTVKALFGQNPSGVTGALEGAAIGLGLSLGAMLAAWLAPRAGSWVRIPGASLGAMCAGALLTVIGGNLFSGSLEIVAGLFANSQIRMDPLAPFFGEVHFGRTTQIVLGALEGTLFGAGVMAGMLFLGTRRKEAVTSVARTQN
jgi:DNA-binding winged helix-turn-helix (wHTH) protein